VKSLVLQPALSIVTSFVVIALLAASAGADDRPWHGSAGGGGSFLVTGSEGDRARFELAVDVEPHGRYGAIVAWRGFDEDGHRGMALAGLVYEAAAARPLLVIDLHGDAGIDLDATAPVAGGGLRTVLTAYKTVGVALDTGGYLVIQGIDNNRFVLSSSLQLVARW
jgi:hypothetical protein